MKFIIFFLIWTNLLANQEQLESIDLSLKKRYSSSGLEGKVSFEAFQVGVKKYYKLQSQGKISSKSIMTFVNFELPSNVHRLFIIEPSSGRLAFSTFVTHGIKTGVLTAEEFSNTPQSYKSSLGFYITKAQYQSGKHGLSMKVQGISPGENDNAMSRLIVIHTSPYADESFIQSNGYMGRSQGCFVVPPRWRDSVIDSLSNNTLIYAYKNQHSQVELSEQEENAALLDKATGQSIELTEKEPKKFDDLTAFQGASSSIQKSNGMNFTSSLPSSSMPESLVGSGSIPEDGDMEPTVEKAGVAQYAGTKHFEKCQLYADRDWNEVATGVQSGKDPSQYFKGSWSDLNDKTRNSEDTEVWQAKNMAQNHLGELEECTAVAAITDTRNLQMEKVNEEHTTQSKDGKISCTYKSAESVDYQECLALIQEHDLLLDEKKETEKNQEDQFKKSANEIVVGTQTSMNSQITAHSSASKLSQNAQTVSNQRIEFQGERAKQLIARYKAIPTYETTLNKCKSIMSKQTGRFQKDYESFSSLYSEVDTSLPKKMNDPCISALARLNLVPIQNRKAREQSLELFKELGEDIESLTSHQQRLNKSEFGLFGSVGKSDNKDLEEESDNSENGNMSGIKLEENRPISTPKWGDNTEEFSGVSLGLAKNSKGKNTGFISSKIRKNKVSKILLTLEAYQRFNKPDEFYRYFRNTLNKAGEYEVSELNKYFNELHDEVKHEHLSGFVSKKKYEELLSIMKTLGIKLHQETTVNRNSSTGLKGQIEIWSDNTDRTIFEIISNRYRTKFNQ